MMSLDQIKLDAPRIVQHALIMGWAKYPEPQPRSKSQVQDYSCVAGRRRHKWNGGRCEFCGRPRLTKYQAIKRNAFLRS